MTPPTDTDGTGGSDSVRTIEEANIANILAKLKAGKVLSRDEEKRLTEYQRRQTAPPSAPDTADLTDKVADSMEQAAALTGFSKDALQRAKNAGCPAFRGSRVYLTDLVEWMQENGDTLPTGDGELDKIQLEIAREKLRKVRHAQDVEEGRYILKEDEAPKILALGLELKDTLRRRLEEEAPDRLAMRPRAEIAEFMKALVDELCTHFQKGAARWSEK